MAMIEIPKNKAEFGEFALDVGKTLVALIEEKDPYLRKHSERVASNCANFCEEFKIVGKDDIATLYFAGLLHDIGIVAIPIRNPLFCRFAARYWYRRNSHQFIA
jgi:HD-GYP domain-containing protein (c-di-GMP phosphodiesterase class II)